MTENDRPHPFGRHQLPIALAASMIVLSAVAAYGQAGDDSSQWRIPAFKARKSNPVPATAQSISKGKALYMQQCFVCHGVGGKGDGPAGAQLQPPPGDLTSPALWAQPDGELFWKITDGKAPMPTFQDALSDKQRWHLVNYVRTLNDRQPTQPQYQVNEGFGQALSKVLDEYSEIGQALAEDDLSKARTGITMFSAAVQRAAALDPPDSPATAKAWRDTIQSLKKAKDTLKQASSLAQTRSAFQGASGALLDTVQKFGHGETGPVFVMRCDKADGAKWLSTNAQSVNPYLGTEVRGSDDGCTQITHLYANQ